MHQMRSLAGFQRREALLQNSAFVRPSIAGLEFFVGVNVRVAQDRLSPGFHTQRIGRVDLQVVGAGPSRHKLHSVGTAQQ